MITLINFSLMGIIATFVALRFIKDKDHRILVFLIFTFYIWLLPGSETPRMQESVKVIQQEVSQQREVLATILNILQATHTNVPCSPVWSDYMKGTSTN